MWSTKPCQVIFLQSLVINLGDYISCDIRGPGTTESLGNSRQRAGPIVRPPSRLILPIDYNSLIVPRRLPPERTIRSTLCRKVYTEVKFDLEYLGLIVRAPLPSNFFGFSQLFEFKRSRVSTASIKVTSCSFLAQNARSYSPQSCWIRLPSCCHKACGECRMKYQWDSYTMSEHNLILSCQASGEQFQRLRQFQELPNIAYTCSTVGWYQGSAYLVLTGTSYSLMKQWFSILTNPFLALLNLHWAQNPKALEEPLNRAMAALITLIAWSSSAWYLRRGVKASGILTATAGLFQAWAALHWCSRLVKSWAFLSLQSLRKMISDRDS